MAGSRSLPSEEAAGADAAAPKAAAVNAVGAASWDLSCTHSPQLSSSAACVQRLLKEPKAMNQNTLHATQVFRAANRLKDLVAPAEHTGFSL